MHPPGAYRALGYTGKVVNVERGTQGQSVDMSNAAGRLCSRRAYVALENLGNTCYMNSILQILRYTPGFVHYLDTLLRAIRWVEHRQLLETCGSCSDRTVKHAASRPLVWTFVQDLYLLYTTMSNHENTLSDTARAIRQLAIKPKKLMDSLCKLNMMYTGNSQHDAHELLRCILSYINEAALEVRRQWPADVNCGASNDVQHPATIPEATAVTCLSTVGTDPHRSQQFLDKPSASQSAPLKSVSVWLTRLKAVNDASRLASSSNSNSASCRVPKGMNPIVLLERIDGPAGCSRSKIRKLEQQPEFGSSADHGAVQACHSQFAGAVQQGVGCGGDKKCCGCGSFLQNGRCQSLQRLFDDADACFRLFQGECVVKKRCLECETIASHTEAFDEIMIPVCKAPPSVDDDPAIMSDGENDFRDQKPTDDGLFSRAFQVKERLQGENKYSCSNCCHYAQADISTHYCSMPPIMTFYLKRFSVTAPGNGGRVVKANDHISTPLVLPCFVCPVGCDSADHQYYLYAIVMHSGSSVNSGHYMSYVRIEPSADCPVAEDERVPCDSARDHSLATNRDRGRRTLVGGVPARRALAESFNWIECNDHFVKLCTANDVRRQLQRCSLGNRMTPYLLFYRKGSDGPLFGMP